MKKIITLLMALMIGLMFVGCTPTDCLHRKSSLGICTECNIVTNPKLALQNYVNKNGTELSTSEYVRYITKSEYINGTKKTFSIYYNELDKSFKFTQTVDDEYISIYPDSKLHMAHIYIKQDSFGDTEILNGYICPMDCDKYTIAVYSFSSNLSYTEEILELLLRVVKNQIVSTLSGVSIMLNETGLGLKLDMFGFTQWDA